MKDDRRCFYLS